MKLLTQELEKKLPELYATEGIETGDKMILCHFFLVDGGFDWYAVEYDPKEKMFFGFVKTLESEWGYFSLAQLEEARGKMGLPVERDLYFTPTQFKNL